MFLGTPCRKLYCPKHLPAVQVSEPGRGSGRSFDIKLPDGQKKYSVTTVTKEQKKLLNACDIGKVDVPNVV